MNRGRRRKKEVYSTNEDEIGGDFRAIKREKERRQKKERKRKKEKKEREGDL